MGAMTALPLPSYHIRPSFGWINDPNGMTYAAGQWHVFFQHNPAAPVHNAIHWGHVTSPDLVTWTEQPVAFGPTSGGPDAFGCWTGVFVPGLERPAVVYSGVADDSHQSSVCLRWGGADLLEWSDPLVVAHTPRDAGVEIMRDPYVFDRDGHRWAIVGAKLLDGDGAVLLFDCDDILSWNYLGVLAAHHDPVFESLPTIDIWECPQLALVGERVALILSAWRAGRLEEVAWVTGDLESHDSTLSFTAQQAGFLDTGNAFYAAHVVNTDDASPLLIGWIREDARPDDALPVAGCLSLPRRLVIDGDGVRCVVHPDVATALPDEDSPERLGPGDHTLPAAGVVYLHGRGRLVGRGGSVGVGGESVSPGIALADGDTVWVDSAVAEVFPVAATASTWRTQVAWTLHLPEGSGASVHRIEGQLRERRSDGAALDQGAGK